MKKALVKNAKIADGGGAFHEKSEKNKKTNNKVRYTELMKIKYGKPKTRGQKKKSS
jgi:ATP-dependent RNA helicase RhlE